MGSNTPNFFRLYLNPFVAQTVYCLNRLLQETFNRDGGGEGECQSFLANSFEAAERHQAGAFAAISKVGRDAGSYWIRPGGWKTSPASIWAMAASSIIPELDVLGPNTPISCRVYGFVVFVPGVEGAVPAGGRIGCPGRTQTPSQLVCVSRFNSAAASLVRGWRAADMVIFDGSFIRGQVPSRPSPRGVPSTTCGTSRSWPPSTRRRFSQHTGRGCSS